MLARLFAAVRAFVAPVLQDRGGASAILLTLMLVPMIGAVGLAIDTSLGYLLKARLGRSLDAAGLAAGRAVHDANVEALAQKYFVANFGTVQSSITLGKLNYAYDQTTDRVTLTSSATTDTYFTRLFGYDHMAVNARTVVERETGGMELALVLDNTGSMGEDNKFGTMRKAAYDLVNILFGPAGSEPPENLWVSVVPFVSAVNVGAAHTDWIESGDRVFKHPNSWNKPKGTWKGCVLERAYPLDSNDTPPTTSKFTSYYWEQSTSYEGDDHNYSCGAPILPLTKSRTSIDAALGQMSIAASGTASNVGLAWGWRTLSPRWRGLWGSGSPSTMPLDYDIDGIVNDQMDKAAILLTDGQNLLNANHYTAYGPETSVRGTMSGTTLDNRLIEVCSAMKAKNIRIYSIIFGKDPNTKTQNLFKSCATSPAMYYYAPTNTSLTAAFHSIGGQLAQLRIVE